MKKTTVLIVEDEPRIKSGKAEKMLCGSCDSHGPYIWGSFEAMRILCSDSNDQAERGSRPMSENPKGFVPGTGAGAVVLETLDSAKERGAHIYAEIIAGDVISGGHRDGGSITASNPIAIQRCITNVINQAGIKPGQIDLISGHLTSTGGDVKEVNNWVEALKLTKDQFPYINAPKSMIGHCLGATGSLETIATVLQLQNGFVHGNLNSRPLHPEIEKIVDPEKIPINSIETNLEYAIKASFGFGDVSSCILLRNGANL